MSRQELLRRRVRVNSTTVWLTTAAKMTAPPMTVATGGLSASRSQTHKRGHHDLRGQTLAR